MIRALLLEKTGETHSPRVAYVEQRELPPADVTIRVDYSSLNYKDGLAITGKGKIVRGAYPFVPGIDLAGVVASSASTRFQEGERVVATGFGIGELTWGGYAQMASVSPDHLVPIPAGLTTRQAMILGTAGLTAMLAVLSLEQQGVGGEIVVSGASGGVGSIALAILAKRGYIVTASTGSGEKRSFLEKLGASTIMNRDELPAAASRALDRSRWGGAIDTVGGATLAGIIAQLNLHASVAACGNAGGAELQTTVYPFILRGVNLLGIDSNWATLEQRTRAWDEMARLLSPETIELLHSETISLEQLPEYAEKITRGEIDGRVIVDVRV